LSKSITAGRVDMCKEPHSVEHENIPKLMDGKIVVSGDHILDAGL